MEKHPYTQPELELKAVLSMETVADANFIAVATDGTNTYRSENGVLTVPAGTYTVDVPAYTFARRPQPRVRRCALSWR